MPHRVNHFFSFMLMRHNEPLPKIKVYQDIEKQLVAPSSTEDTQLLQHSVHRRGIIPGRRSGERGDEMAERETVKADIEGVAAKINRGGTSRSRSSFGSSRTLAASPRPDPPSPPRRSRPITPFVPPGPWQTKGVVGRASRVIDTTTAPDSAMPRLNRWQRCNNGGERGSCSILDPELSPSPYFSLFPDALGTTGISFRVFLTE